MKRIIFACVHSAGRSQMATAFFNHYADPQKAQAVSAGTEPASHVHPEVLIVMNEVGIDLSQARPNFLSAQLAATANLLVTMGCGERCPYVPGLEVRDWPLEDPKGKDLAQVRSTRDKIKSLVLDLIQKNRWQSSEA